MKQKCSAFTVILILTLFSPAIVFPGAISISKVGEWGSRYYTDVVIKDNYAYCIISGREFSIMDLSNPANPREKALYDLDGGRAEELAVDGNFVYIVGPYMGLQIFDVSQPANPVRVSNCNTFTWQEHVYVAGNYAYVGNDQLFGIVDISNPGSPVLRGKLDINGRITSIRAKGNYVYLGTANYLTAYYTAGLHVIDVSNPDAPALATVYDTGYWNDIWGVEVIGGYAYMVSFETFYVLDISDVTRPFAAGSVTIDPIGTRSGVGLCVKGDHAYVALNERSLNVIDITTPSSPVPAGTYSSTKISYDVAAFGNYAFARSVGGGFSLLDVTNPASPTLFDEYYMEDTGTPESIFCSGDHAYVLDRREGLKIIDVSVPTSPIQVGGYPKSPDTTGGWKYNDFYVHGNYAYLIDADGNLKIIDLSVPSSPRLVGQYDLDGMVGRLYVKGNFAYISIFDKGLKILDVSDPTSPEPVGEYTGLKSVTGIYVAGNYAYLMGNNMGLRIIDVSNPAAPVLVGQCETTSETVRGLVVVGKYAYLDGGEMGWEVIDVSDVKAPVPLINHEVLETIHGLYVDGNYIHLACGNSGLLVYDITDPVRAVLVGSYRTVGIANDVCAAGNTVYVLDGRLSILKIAQSPSFPRITLSRSHLNFAADTGGVETGVQSVRIGNDGGGNLNWSVSDDQSWMGCAPDSGGAGGEFSVSVNSAELSPGTYTGTVTVSAQTASNSPQTVTVTLTVYQAGKTSVPFGVYSTPVEGSIVSSSVPFTGWVLDDIGVKSVQLFRETGKSLAYIGDALFVEGARPDVEQAYPNHPGNTAAGWGYMMLTNFLPGGDGTFTIHAVATDMEGHTVTLGTKTVTVDNAHAVKPFGAVDTPAQGGAASGTRYANHGWALTPLPNAIPEDGTTMQVWVDGVSQGNPVYNQYREDIETLFPGYANSGGAGGYFILDTTAFENGVHTIAWSAEDDAGNVDGIGSRYFKVRNNTQSAGSRAQSGEWSFPDIPVDFFGAVDVVKGYREVEGPCEIYPDDKGTIRIETNELERLTIRLGPVSRWTWIGYLAVGDRLKPLPIGSVLDGERGVFHWQPGPGFVGDYDLVFIYTCENGDMVRKNIKISILPLQQTIDRMEKIF